MLINESKTVVPELSDTASGSAFDTRTVSEGTQESTKQLLRPAQTANGSLHAAPMPLSRDSFNVHRMRLMAQNQGQGRQNLGQTPTKGIYKFYRVGSTGQVSPWPFRNATPRESLGSVDVSLMSSAPPSMQARTVSDLSSSDRNENGSDVGVSRASSVIVRPGAINKVTIHEVTSCHKSDLLNINGSSSGALTDRPPTPIPALTIRSVNDNAPDDRNAQQGLSENNCGPNEHENPFADQAGPIDQLARAPTAPSMHDVAPWTRPMNNGVPSGYTGNRTRALSRTSDGSHNISQIPRMSSIDLGRTAREFLRPSQANLRGAGRDRTPSPPIVRTRGLVRRAPVWDTTYINEAFGHPRVLKVAGGVFIIVVFTLVSGIAVVTAYAVRGVPIDAGHISWIILNVATALLSGTFLYAVYTRNREQRKKERAELLALRARHSRHQDECRDLEGQIELANIELAHLRNANDAGNEFLAARVDSQVNRRIAEIMAQGQGSDGETVRVAPPSNCSIRGSATPTGRRQVSYQSPPPPPPSPSSTIEREGARNPRRVGVTPSGSEASILTQLCEGVIANNGGPRSQRGNTPLSIIREREGSSNWA